MLDRKEIEKYGPPGFHLSQKEKDYAQHWILSFLSRVGFGGVFKGGTYLQKAFGLPRYSEDLDFTLNDAEEPDLEAISAYLSSAGFSGLVWKKQSISVSISLKLRYRGPLYAGSSISEGTVLLEFSKREKTMQKAVPTLITPPYIDLLPYSILTMGLEEIAAEKIRAMMIRTSARDLFDLYFLLRKGTKLKNELIRAKLKYYELAFEFKAFEKSMAKLHAIWKNEIKALSPNYLEYEIAAEFVLNEAKKQLV